VIAASAVPSSAALELRGISKRFGAVVALQDASLTVRPGTVHVVLGENGAGKTTLMRIAYGIDSADSGVIRFFGRDALGGSVREAAEAGTGMVHQHLSLVPSLTTEENLVLGRRGLYHPHVARALLERVGGEAGLRVPVMTLVRDLSLVEQQRLEIVKALAFGARVLILDEPTAILAPGEVEDLLRWIRAFVAGGGSVVFVTHKLREALAVADDVTVLRRGRVTFASAVHGVTEASLAAAIFPEAVPERSTSTAPGLGFSSDVVVEARNLDVVDAARVRRVQQASFSLRRGDRVGVAAVDGSGHRELLLALAGYVAPASGSLRLPDASALIPADRARDAVIGDFTLTENVALRGLGARRRLMPWAALREQTRGLIDRFNIVAESASAPLRTLSGGNQQRLVVARELSSECALVVADNPTRGLDVKAAAFVHEQLRAAASNGAVVVLHSSDIDEVLAFASRVLVVFHGSVRECPPDRDLVGRAMLGAT